MKRIRMGDSNDQKNANTEPGVGQNDAAPVGGSSMPQAQMGGGGPAASKKKAMMLGLIAVLLIGGGVAAYMLMSSDKKEAETPVVANVKVGVMVPLTGDASASGFGELKGAQLAKKQLGATNIEIVQEDSKCNKDDAAKAIKNLIAKGVVAIIGEACSSASLGALPDANSSKVPMISPSASSPTLSIANDYFFRVIPPDNFQGKFMAKTMLDRDVKKVSILHTNESYGTSLKDVFTTAFTEGGGSVVSTGSFEPGDINLGTQINAVKAAKPDAIYLIVNGASSASAALKLARDAGITAKFYGSDGVNDAIVVKNAGDAAEGLLATSFPGGTKAFKQAFLNEYETNEFSYGSPQAYDAFHAIYLAVQKGASTGETVKNALTSVSFAGVSGPIKFDKNGEISNTDYKYDLLVVKDGAFVTEE